MRQAILTGKGRRWLLGGHPWVYRDDVAAAEGEPGDLLPVFCPNETPLGWALFSTHSKITLRMVTHAAEQPNRAFWADRVRSQVAWRAARGLLEPEGACRLLNGDADGVPGFVVDRYADVLVIQSGCQGSDRMRDFLLELLLEALPHPVRAVLDRSDTSVRRLENLPERVEWLQGAGADGKLPGGDLVVREDELSYEVDPLAGHKTGHYLDQRENRRRAATFADGRRALDAFSYDGLFGIRAALKGAESVLCLEQSAAALERLTRNAERNGVADRVRTEKVDAMQALRSLAKEGERFGLVVVDPPAFARNRQEAEGAGRGYRELNLRAISLVAPDGELVSSSCSFAVRRERFLELLSQAARDSERSVYLEEFAGAGPDHTALLTLPESSYLKCAFLRVG